MARWCIKFTVMQLSDSPFYWCEDIAPDINVVKYSCFDVFSDNHYIYYFMYPFYGLMWLWVFNRCTNRFDVEVFQNWDDISFEFWTVVENYSVRSWIVLQPYIIKLLAYFGRCFTGVILFPIWLLCSRSKELLRFWTNRSRYWWS